MGIMLTRHDEFYNIAKIGFSILGNWTKQKVFFHWGGTAITWSEALEMNFVEMTSKR
jgi:hypothetical protein